MNKLIAILLLALAVAVPSAAQLTVPLGGSSTEPAPKRTRPTSKTLTGTVSDKSDRPIAGAVVYLKNSKTLVVKSFFAEDNGSYRFPQLALNTDYEVWAEKDGKKSSTKSVSQFDDRYAPIIDLRIDLNK